MDNSTETNPEIRAFFEKDFILDQDNMTDPSGNPITYELYYNFCKYNVLKEEILTAGSCKRISEGTDPSYVVLVSS
jgi:hypothetical protein